MNICIIFANSKLTLKLMKTNQKCKNIFIKKMLKNVQH